MIPQKNLPENSCEGDGWGCDGDCWQGDGGSQSFRLYYVDRGADLEGDGYSFGDGWYDGDGGDNNPHLESCAIQMLYNARQA